MPALMIDTDTPSLLLEPRFATMRVATYADLVTPQLLTELAGRLVVIDRGLGDPLNVATVADIEPGALSVTSGAALLRLWTAQKRPFPTAYHDRALQAQVDIATAGLGIFNWVATLDGTLLPAGRTRAVVQFAGEQVTGFHGDMSIVWDDGWHPLTAGPATAAVHAVQQAAAALSGPVAALQQAVREL